MGFLGWIFSFFDDLFGSDSDSCDCGPDVNPVSGLPMVEGGGVDVAGNPYGMDLSDRPDGFGDSFSSFTFEWDD